MRHELARERLAEARELRVEDPEQGLRRQLGHATGVVEHRPVRAEEGPVVGGLHEPHLGTAQDRSEHAVDEVTAEVRRVRVQVHHDVAADDRERAPHRIALSEGGAELRNELVLAVDLQAVPPRDLCRAVRGARIDGDDLVDERRLLVQRGENLEASGHLRKAEESSNPDVKRAALELLAK